ncbi:hypothetical protein PGT21_013823 [Puccinia graminis f. sp. tritici]|uniref:CxC1-like cysteine cluster associated with KDZ transposases domain-containing protein n=1 Tax=Puccinia graminis f. sp. tritici TaxID=56615 RepID=A0A5B0N588_PUCGR|nr:hypothetical protein PGTUg99_025041 [Puccinia graminis f. sp. tritici]KAA1094221.1 hypothetical protein PGT21_013823 [Puccinia graminis f. sp. tritici]
MVRNSNRRRDPTFIVNNLNTGTSRHSRSTRAQLRNQAEEIQDRRAFLEEVSIARELGFVDSSFAQGIPRPPTGPTDELPDPVITGNYVDLDTHQQADEAEAQLPCAAHAAYHRARRYAEARERLSQRWTELEEQATTAFLLCQKLTKNWQVHVNPKNSYFNLLGGTCTCDPTHVVYRNMDLFDFLHQESAVRVPFCHCIPDVVRLIHYGYIASSPDVPRTAFSIRLLEFHDCIWKTAVVSTTSFVQALISTYLARQNAVPIYARGSNYRKRNLRVPFSHSKDLYSRIQVLKKQIFVEGLQLSQTEQWANQCPRCFGPIKHENKSDPNEPTVIIALDGNFQQRHYAYASKDNPSENNYPPQFLQPSNITSIANSFEATEASAVGIDPPCADSHKAANDTRGASTWEKCDDNGLHIRERIGGLQLVRTS